VSKPVALAAQVRSTVKPVQKSKVHSSLVPVQASANAPFAARTQLRVQNRPIRLIGGVVEKHKRDSGQLFGSDSPAFKA